MSLVRAIVIRHDVTGANGKGIQGGTNTPLQKTGSRTRINNLTDMLVEEGELYTESPDLKVYVDCSDLNRAYETGDGVHNRLNHHGIKSEVHFTPYLNERGQGCLEGLSFDQALPILAQLVPKDIILTPDAESIFPLLYSLDNVPGQTKQGDVTKKLEQYIREHVEEHEGIGILVVHSITGMNYLVNLLMDGNILGNPQKPFKMYPNLGAVVLERDEGNRGRYIQTRTYLPPNGKPNGLTNGAIAVQTSR